MQPPAAALCATRCAFPAGWEPRLCRVSAWAQSCRSGRSKWMSISGGLIDVRLNPPRGLVIYDMEENRDPGRHDRATPRFTWKCIRHIDCSNSFWVNIRICYCWKTDVMIVWQGGKPRIWAWATTFFTSSVLSGWSQDSAQASQVLPHRTCSSTSLWAFVCELVMLERWESAIPKVFPPSVEYEIVQNVLLC